MNPYSTTTSNTPLTKMAVCSDIFLFTFVLLDTGGLIFLLIYFIITLSDLECDYLNAQECCAKLNFVSRYTYLIRIFNINETNKFKLYIIEIWAVYDIHTKSKGLTNSRIRRKCTLWSKLFDDSQWEFKTD